MFLITLAGLISYASSPPTLVVTISYASLTRAVMLYAYAIPHFFSIDGSGLDDLYWLLQTLNLVLPFSFHLYIWTW